MSDKLVIIGGVAAGTSAAAKARRIDPKLDITVYSNDEYISYAGCGLPYFIGGKIDTKEKLLARSVADFANQNIKVKTLVRVEEIKPESGKIIVQDLTDANIFEAAYDRLVIATGARPIIPNIDGIQLQGVFSLRTIHDSLRIKEYLSKHKPKKVVIIGAGYIGLEMAENLIEYGCQVSIIEKSPHIIPNMDEDMALILNQYLESMGVEVRTGETVTGFIGDETVSGIYTDKGHIAADFVLLSLGVRPNSEIAASIGIEIGTKNAIRVNSRMVTSIENIYAAGDCATTVNLVSGKEVFIPMGTTANKQGRVAGENAAGGQAAFKGVLGTGIARVIEMEISRTGLSESECQALGIEYVSQRIKSRTAAHYSSNSKAIHLKLIADRSNKRLLGAQIVGYSGAAMRINILAAAITLGASVEDLIDMDLAYSPPFSPVWDPVLIALNQFE